MHALEWNIWQKNAKSKSQEETRMELYSLFALHPIGYIDCNTLINLSLEAKCFN